MNIHKVFVYGTLRPSNVATHVLEGYAMFQVDGRKFNFPYIQKIGEDMEDAFQIQGNVVEVDDEALSKMDKYEGVANGMYVREGVYVYANVGEGEYDYGSEIEVWAYVAGPALAYKHITSGNWFDR